jgi:hypothetical protein
MLKALKASQLCEFKFLVMYIIRFVLRFYHSSKFSGTQVRASWRDCIAAMSTREVQGSWIDLPCGKLIGDLEHEFYDFPYIGNVIIPTVVHSIIFQVEIPPTRKSQA